jgi:hypothetical protein
LHVLRLAAYRSGVRHQEKIPRMITSATDPAALAIICQPFTVASRKGSVLVQALCSDRDLTLVGYLAAAIWMA